MSFSGRRLSILRPSNRRFSVGKELSENGMSIVLFLSLLLFCFVFFYSCSMSTAAIMRKCGLHRSKAECLALCMRGT